LVSPNIFRTNPAWKWAGTSNQLTLRGHY